eukprot:8763008-Lingulodinium_polyedra.AAC.1
MKSLSLHPVVHSGLYWCLQWAIKASAVHSDLYGCLQCVILESTGGSIEGSTAGSILLPDLEYTVGSTWESTVTWSVDFPVEPIA